MGHSQTNLRSRGTARWTRFSVSCRLDRVLRKDRELMWRGEVASPLAHQHSVAEGNQTRGLKRFAFSKPNSPCPRGHAPRGISSRLCNAARDSHMSWHSLLEHWCARLLSRKSKFRRPPTRPGDAGLWATPTPAHPGRAGAVVVIPHLYSFGLTGLTR